MQAPKPHDEPVYFAPKDRALRADVGHLGGLLGELLRELAPAGIYETVEGARKLARRRRRGDAKADAELARQLTALEPSESLEVVRAFSAYFGLVNMAEQVHRLRRSIDYLKADEDQPGGLRAVARKLKDRGTTLDEVQAALARVRIEPVFTAHPTESVRRTLLKKDQRLARALVERFQASALDPVALGTLDRRIALEVASAWQTEEQLAGRPTVADEVEHVLFYLSDVLYRVVPSLHEEVERAFERAYDAPLRIERPLVRFASWVGGDMDGNPNVGADTIRASLERHRELAIRRYKEELRGLHEHLSQSLGRVGVDEGVLERVREYAARFPEEFESIPPSYSGMPYRQFLWLMSERLTRRGRDVEGGYEDPDSFSADLGRIALSLQHNGGSRAGLDLVRRAMWRVDVFGFHLAALDVRQDAEVHRRVVGSLLGDPEFAQRAPAERAALITRALAAGTHDLPSEPDDETHRTLEVFRALAEARRRYGERALGPYVISMAQGPDDALAVLWLARVGGCLNDKGRVPIDVAPLFETVTDLEAGPSVLDALAADPTYAEHLTQREGRQVVMLGYSDSSKDGGIAASRVALNIAQERLAATAAAHELDLTLFHGRGGSISRGGSKPRAALLAAPRNTLGWHARTTEQGEIVGSKFGLRGIATRTLEVSLGALLERTAGGDPARAATDGERALAETLGATSRSAYRALVHDHPDFPELFRLMTPLDVIERLEIGSRPSRRRAMRGVEDLRAIPWVFAWTQCRAVLPGWFGVGTGLAATIEAHGLEATRRAARDWPFFATLLADVEMVLAKSDLVIAGRYAELAGDVGRGLFPLICEEHERTVSAVLEVTESTELLDRDPTLRRAIRLRNPYVDPLSLVQIDLLRRWREGDHQDVELERVLAQTVRGIARGLRNTG